MRTRIKIKRAYDAPDAGDGKRILVDRLWPRGLTKEKAKIDYWAKDISPSNELRKWYGHEPGKWEEFKKRYFSELDRNRAEVDELIGQMGKGPVTFVYSSTERVINNAEALKNYLERKAITKK
ncbi:MAG TPA: DUF488 family protein [Syntrophales bacterium]|nr:DUF488 family protein [Syntrophales bacterium]